MTFLLKAKSNLLFEKQFGFLNIHLVWSSDAFTKRFEGVSTESIFYV